MHDNYWLNTSGGNRLTRRRFISGASAAGLGLSAAALAACSSSNNGTTSKAPTTAAQPSATRPPGAATAVAGQATPAANASPAAAAVKRGGELHLGVTTLSGNQTMDPHISLSKAFTYWGVFSEKLLDTDHQKFEPVQPQLVEKWEQVDPMNTNLTVRQGAAWHEGKITNGRPFTAKDAAFNLMRMAGLLDPQRKTLFQRASLLGGMDKAEAVDDKTVKVTFSSVNAQFLSGLTDFRQIVVPQEQVDKDPDFKSVKDFSGTGPFIIQSYDDTSYAASYTANKKYWRQGMPYLDGVKHVSFSDSASQLAGFLSGQTHIYTGANIQADRKSIQSSRPDIKLFPFEFVVWPEVSLNQQRGALKDARVRQALQLSLNYKDMLDTNYGSEEFYDYSAVLCSSLPGAYTSAQVKQLPGWNSATKQADITKAKQLMEAAGFPNGKGVSFGYLSYSLNVSPNFPVILKDQWEKIFTDIKVNLDAAPDMAAFSNRQVKGDFDAIDYSFQSIPNTILEATVHYRTGASRNYSQFSDSEVDALIDKGFVEFDANKRLAIIGDLQKKLLDDMLIITYGKYKYVFGLDPKLHGMQEWSGPGSAGGYDINTFAGTAWFG